MNVAVVGAGIAGASAARFLAARGHGVSLFERFSLGHKFGSSHGSSRIVRRAYPDAFYTDLMAAAYPMWAELQEESGKEVLHECGLVMFGPEGAPNMRDTARGLAELGVTHEVRQPSDLEELFPALRLTDGEVGIYTPEAGWVNADVAVQASLDLAERAGANLMTGQVAALESLQKYDAFVVCAGAWIRDFVPVPVRVTLQTVAYIGAPMEGPVWIEDSPEFAYGFPTDGSHSGFKMGVHRPGPASDPDDLDRAPRSDYLAIMRDVAVRRFGIEDPQITEATGCLYTSTMNEDFLFGRIGQRGYFASACSGHGFKFGPWVGKRLADFVEGRAAPEDLPRLLHAPAR